jgi:hypothetical protein
MPTGEVPSANHRIGAVSSASTQQSDGLLPGLAAIGQLTGSKGDGSTGDFHDLQQIETADLDHGLVDRGHLLAGHSGEWQEIAHAGSVPASAFNENCRR